MSLNISHHEYRFLVFFLINLVQLAHAYNVTGNILDRLVYPVTY
uniref:Uncharacterized protein n=1 Tax=Anguilla anguilla TaxID=7936 RepID=A0A0E9RK94_ANGAN